MDVHLSQDTKTVMFLLLLSVAFAVIALRLVLSHMRRREAMGVHLHYTKTIFTVIVLLSSSINLYMHFAFDLKPEALYQSFGIIMIGCLLFTKRRSRKGYW